MKFSSIIAYAELYALVMVLFSKGDKNGRKSSDSAGRRICCHQRNFRIHSLFCKSAYFSSNGIERLPLFKYNYGHIIKYLKVYFAADSFET